MKEVAWRRSKFIWIDPLWSWEGREETYLSIGANIFAQAENRLVLEDDPALGF